MIAIRWHGASAGTTTRAAIEAVYDERAEVDELPRRLFVKCTSTLVQRLMLGLGGFICGEPGFYAQIRPHLGIEAPVGYHGAVDPRSWHSVLVIEDVVATRGARFWRPSTSITRAQLEGLLGSMAAWHGAMWNSPRLDACRWLKTPAEQMQVIDALLGLADRTPAGIRRARDVIPASVAQRKGRLLDALRCSMTLQSRRPHTYLHGDLHIANTYLTRGGTIGVADWQCGLRGSWAHDFAYLMATAVPVEERRAWERQLLGLYVSWLSEAGGGRVELDAAWLAYRQSTFYPLFAWLYTLGRSALQPRFQPDDIALALLERIGAAIADLDSFGAVGV